MTSSTIRSIPDSGTAPIARGPLLENFQQYSFTSGGIAHPVYYTGDPHYPPLLLMSELAGFSPGLLLFAERLKAAQFQVHVPWMFGAFNKRTPLRNAAKLCISREFSRLRVGVSAPITIWLRALASHISQYNDDRHVGAIGMCLTGAFAIPLVINPRVVAAVAAQPAVPLSFSHALFGVNASGSMQGLNASDEDIVAARKRLNVGDAHLLACRFQADRICPANKLERLRQEFPIGLETHEYAPPEWRNALGNRPHATFTKEYRIVENADADHPSRLAFNDLVGFFKRHL